MPTVRLFPVLLAGGASSRLWPASANDKPKWDLRLFKMNAGADSCATGGLPTSAGGADIPVCPQKGEATISKSVCATGGSPTSASGADIPVCPQKGEASASLLESTYARARKVAAASDCFVVTAAAQAALIQRSLPELPLENILVEPEVRDTAGALAYAAGAIARKIAAENLPPEHAVMLVLPGDHVIRDLDRFADCARTAAAVATETGALMTFGIVPRAPVTGYGYVQRGETIKFGGADILVCPQKGEATNPDSVCATGGSSTSAQKGEASISKSVCATGGSSTSAQKGEATIPKPIPVFKVAAFKEKPDLATAEKYVASGEYFWNGGIFAWQMSALRHEFKTQLPGHEQMVEALAKTKTADEWTATAKQFFPQLKKTSIDFGIMEGAKNVATVQSDFDWDDIGSWSAVGPHLNEVEGNQITDDTKLLNLDSQHNIVFAPGKRVALIGVEGLSIVVTGNDILICRTERDQDVKKINEMAKK